MIESGVRSSWETLATKSRRTFSRFLSWVMSCSTAMAPTGPDTPAGVIGAVVIWKCRTPYCPSGWRTVNESDSERDSPAERVRRAASRTSWWRRTSSSGRFNVGADRPSIVCRPRLARRIFSSRSMMSTPSLRLPRTAWRLRLSSLARAWATRSRPAMRPQVDRRVVAGADHLDLGVLVGEDFQGGAQPAQGPHPPRVDPEDRRDPHDAEEKKGRPSAAAAARVQKEALAVVKRYPSPRTVSMRAECAGPSFSRRRRTWVSTVRVSMAAV